MKSTIVILAIVLSAACDGDKSEKTIGGESSSSSSSTGAASSSTATTSSDCDSSEPVPEECIDQLVAECSGLSRDDCAAHASGDSCLWVIELTGEAMCVEGAGSCVAVRYPGEGGPGPRWFDSSDRVYDIQCDVAACKDLVPVVYRMKPLQCGGYVSCHL